MNAVLTEDKLTTEPTDSAPEKSVGATVASEPVSSAQLAKEQTPVEPDPPRDEADRIEPDVTGPITLSSGRQVEVVPLKLRETMKLLKIVTRGAGAVLESLIGDLDLNDPVAFAQTLGALILMSIPEAENEVVDFVRCMVRPFDFDNLPADEKVKRWTELGAELGNPELDDVISVVERVVRRESEDIRSLGKRLTTAFSLGRKVGELPAPSEAK